jgi:phosphate transport system protein
MEKPPRSKIAMTTVPRPTLDQELQSLQDDLLRMGNRLDTAIERSLQALVNRDLALAGQVIAEDELINGLRYQIEEACFTTLATQQPAARDLRAVMAAFSIASDLERMADHAAGIATITVRLGAEPLLKPLVDIPRMAEVCRDMVRRALEAYVTHDVTKACAVAETDDVIDNLYQQVFRELLTYMLDDPGTLSRALPLLFVGHNLERIGDRAVNVAERTIFIASGELKEFKSDPQAANAG